MDVAALNAWMDRHFTRSAFRLETLQTYEVASDGSDYKRYLDGEPTWTPERKQPWLDHLAAEKARGLRRSRVRIVTHPVTAYTRYECEWGYVPNAVVGEHIRILDVSEHRRPDVRGRDAGDFWYAVDADDVGHVARMVYGPDGQFVGAQEVQASHTADYWAAWSILWESSEPFKSWWDRHPDLHRDQAVSPTR